MRRKILRRRGVRFRLALFEFVVRFDFFRFAAAVVGAEYVALVDDIADVVVLIVMHVVVMLVAVLFVMSFDVSFVVLAVMFFVLLRLKSVVLAAPANCFAGQNFSGNRRGGLRRCMAVRVPVPMAVIVVLKIFENVANVQEGVAVEADIDERGLHTGEHPSNAALVDATDQREFLFALDINFD